MDVRAIDCHTSVEVQITIGSMVASTTSLQSKKRKATIDMPNSPPKRVTRARAKATEEVPPEIKTTKITTASARIAAENKIPAKTSTITKRKLRGTDQKLDTEQATEGADDTSTELLEAPKSRGRPRKITKESKSEVVETRVIMRTRSHLEKAGLDQGEIERTTKKLKNKPKPTEGKEGKEEKLNQIDLIVSNATIRTTRARTTIDKSKAPTLRKKVTFENPSQEDKENLAIPSANTKKAQPKSLGLRAKPVRKPAATNVNLKRKGTLSSKEKKVDIVDLEDAIKPLSPKKVTQVAKSSSISSEDELCGDKSPLRTLSKSPVKLDIGANKTQVENPMVDLVFSTESSVKLSTSSVLASPARRPPPSPSKGILNESPKRINFDNSITIPFPRSQNASTLKDSPRRVNLGSTVAVPSLSHSQTPIKASLFQSPARRPVSALKPAIPLSPAKSLKATKGSHSPNDREVTNNFKLPVFTPSKLLSSPLRAAKSTKAAVKVHQMTPEEIHAHTPEMIDRSRDKSLEHEVMCMEDIAQFAHTAADITSVSENLLANREDSEPELPQDVSTTQCTTPPGEPTYNATGIPRLASTDFRSTAEESDSEDELQPTHDTINKSPCHRKNGRPEAQMPTALATPSTSGFNSLVKQPQSHNYDQHGSRIPFKTVDTSMTPLAIQLSSWLASSPDRKASRHGQNESYTFSSSSNQSRFNKAEGSRQSFQTSSPVKSTLFDDEMHVREQEITASAEGEAELEYPNQVMIMDIRQQSEDPEEFGDENAVPIDPQLFSPQYTRRPTLETCTPARVFQPNPREIHTVSKVPLRPAGDESPLALRRTRSQSFSESSKAAKGTSRPGFVRSNTVISYSLGDDCDTDLEPCCQITGDQSDAISAIVAPATPISNTLTNIATPTRTRTGADAQIMRGAVVFVDVHTTEGADASGIFIELLTQMGARCVKHWKWNPRAVLNREPEQACSVQNDSPNEANTIGKVGITHVVYKDGGNRTLEKVQESNGLVLCVGVGWVLE